MDTEALYGPLGLHFSDPVCPYLYQQRYQRANYKAFRRTSDGSRKSYRAWLNAVYPRPFVRTDAVLIAHIRAFQQTKAAEYCTLKVATIPAFWTWSIGDYDSMEHVVRSFPWEGLCRALLAHAEEDPLVEHVRLGTLALPPPGHSRLILERNNTWQPDDPLPITDTGSPTPAV